MRGGLERWKRGVDSHGVRAAIAYAFDGDCDVGARLTRGVEALAEYSDVAARSATRFIVEDGDVRSDRLDRVGLARWVDGCDPVSGERRGRELLSPQADLVLDGTINAPKSFSIAALVHGDLAVAFEALQDRLRDRVIRIWQHELNARRGAAGCLREPIHRLEVVELQHRRSRALDPHIHRHLWLGVKVQGMDGKWSNVDSRVAMRLHTLINAEGELAARTDPEWVAALARHGYTINPDGEIAELAHAVRPLSRRSNQIEANRAVLLARWRAEHPGSEPDRDVLASIDRLAWAWNRPRKPDTLDEADWAHLVRDELAAIDPGLLRDATGIPVLATVADLDVARLARQALEDADQRSAACGGRFSLVDVRAGATRAVAGSGVVAAREGLVSVIDEVIETARLVLVDLLEGADRPAHVKAFMAPVTARLKQDLADRFDRLNTPGAKVSIDEVERIASRVLDATALDDRQADAVAAIAGGDRLVTITGPAGAGKTTVLRVAHAALRAQRRNLLVVAPTKKAASVAGREIGTTGSSLHALLHDHGWRWGRDDYGAQQWTRLARGAPDEDGRVYPGPRRFPLHAGDRVVVDEAGMVDLHAARALAALAEEAGVGIAMIGDHLQAMPVGHSGAMACMARRSGTLVELSTVHRFHDTDYASLTLRMREPATRADAIAVATELQAGGHLRVVPDQAAARDAMVDAYFAATAHRQRVALVTATNEDAAAVNDAIQQRRVELGALVLDRIVAGAEGQRILCGDLVQTRRNDSVTGVENRAVWVVAGIRHDGIQLVSVTDSGERRTVTGEYAADHLQLAYASTVHGIQGETTDGAVVGPGVGAAGLYVGMTRGRGHNEAIVIAHPNTTPIGAIADTLMRGRVEVTLDDARSAARTDLARSAQPAQERHYAQRIAEIERIEQWLTTATRTVHVADAAAATERAATHGRRAPTEPTPSRAIERLRTAIAHHSNTAAMRDALIVAPTATCDTSPLRTPTWGGADPPTSHRPRVG